MSNNNNNNNKRIITKAERLAKLKLSSQKLDNHINEGVSNYVKESYLDGKEARINQRWYQAGEALAEAKVQADIDGDLQFKEEFSAWAQQQQEEYYAELDAREAKMLEAEDVIDVEFKPLELPSSRRGRRQSKLISSSTPFTPNILPSSVEPDQEEETNPYNKRKKPS